MTARASSLKWTLEVYQQVIRRENEEKIKEEEKKAQTVSKRGHQALRLLLWASPAGPFEFFFSRWHHHP